MEKGHEEEELSCEDQVEVNEMRIEALIQLLVDKKIIAQEEFEKKIDDLYPDED